MKPEVLHPLKLWRGSVVKTSCSFAVPSCQNLEKLKILLRAQSHRHADTVGL